MGLKIAGVKSRSVEWLHVRVVDGSQVALAEKNSLLLHVLIILVVVVAAAVIIIDAVQLTATCHKTIT